MNKNLNKKSVLNTISLFVFIIFTILFIVNILTDDRTMLPLIVYNSIALIAGAVYDITSDDEHQNDTIPDTKESSQKHESDTDDVEHDERDILPRLIEVGASSC